ncbi:MAG: hypothetical protein H0V17_25195, partial [Deltaproteobacteria bacterium]|nr:hypothetical protein [Deltaproteobacteria bacterium]
MRSSILISFFICAVGCGTDGGGSGDDDGTPDAPPADGVPASEVQFQRDVAPIFVRSCGNGNDACHNRNPYAANLNFECRGWLSLENASIGSQVYAGSTAGQPTGCEDRPLHYRLTEIKAWQCGEPASSSGTNVNYVVPGDLENSYIIRKLRGMNLCDEGNTVTVQ